MSCNYDQSSVEFRFSFGREQDCRRALTGTGHSVVLHCLGSARLICHEIDQFGYFLVHCSGLGGGLLSGEHEYDIFLQNLAQTKVYGPSLAMTDNWEEHITQLGLTKTVHEYAVYQLLSTADGWTAWRDFLPETVL